MVNASQTFDAAQIRAEAGVAPTILAPTTLDDDQVATAWHIVRQAYLQNPLRIDERAALLCAALERDGPRASSVHATGVTLVGQDDIVDVGRVWNGMLQTDRGRRLLDATTRLGQGKQVDPKVLQAIYKDLGPLTSAWQQILQFAAWVDIWHRSQAPLATASSDPRVDEWLKVLVEAKDALQEAAA